MAYRHAGKRQGRENCTEEKAYPASGLGRSLMLIGMAMVVLFACWWFWMAVIGAVLIVVGYLVLQSC